jgi:hypothetical protein
MTQQQQMLSNYVQCNCKYNNIHLAPVPIGNEACKYCRAKLKNAPPAKVEDIIKAPRHILYAPETKEDLYSALSKIRPTHYSIQYTCIEGEWVLWAYVVYRAPEAKELVSCARVQLLIDEAVVAVFERVENLELVSRELTPPDTYEKYKLFRSALRSIEYFIQDSRITKLM